MKKDGSTKKKKSGTKTDKGSQITATSKTPPKKSSTGEKSASKTVKKKSIRSKTAQKKTSSVKKSTSKKKGASVSKKSSMVPGRSTAKKVSRKNKAPEKHIEDQYEELISDEAKLRGDNPMSLVDHLDEMRSRLLIVLATIIVFSIAGFFLSDYLLNFINQPFLTTGHKLNIFKLTGGFMIRLKASVVVGLLAAVPVIVLQIWGFIKPAVGVEERKFSHFAIAIAILLFYGGIFFVFYGLLPFAIPMLLSFISTDMLSTIGADDYMTFIFVFSLAMGLLFELPIVVMILTRIGILTPVFLIQKRKHAIVIIWIVAALITPADVLSQILVAVPLMFLYELSILVSKTMVRRRNKLLADRE